MLLRTKSPMKILKSWHVCFKDNSFTGIFQIVIEIHKNATKALCKCYKLKWWHSSCANKIWSLFARDVNFFLKVMNGIEWNRKWFLLSIFLGNRIGHRTTTQESRWNQSYLLSTAILSFCCNLKVKQNVKDHQELVQRSLYTPQAFCYLSKQTGR